MQIKTKWDYLTPVRWPSAKNPPPTSAREDVEKREPSCTAGGNVSWYSHYGRQYIDSLKKKKKKQLGLKPPYDPVTPLLGIYFEETKT